MVALAILGMGLLVIAAALPAGAKYTKDSIDQVNGAAAADYALDLIEQNVSLRDRVYYPPADPNKPIFASATPWHCPALFQPRDPLSGRPAADPADPNRLYAPLMKVRPLFAQNIIAASTVSGLTRGMELFDPQGTPLQKEVLVEAAIWQWLTTFGITGTDTKEHDPTQSPGPWLRPSLPSVSLVYPPISADTAFDPGFWYSTGSNGSTMLYNARPVLQTVAVGVYGPGAETAKALDRRIVWTALYRRVSYAAGSDPTLYEIIVVVSSRPTVGHRFPVQDPATGGKPDWSINPYYGIDSLAPVPWLVTFDNNDPNALPRPYQWDGAGDPNFGTGSPPATLTFRCTADLDPLFPVGSIFIPARNDDHPSLPKLFGARANVHFGGPAPTALPIYEVSQRPDLTTVVVKYNGYYPQQWAVGGAINPTTPAAADWPVWVIPPVIESVDATTSPAKPIFNDRSPILAVTRRYVKLREVP